MYHKSELKKVFPLMTKEVKSGLYFLYDEKGHLLYIGKAKSLYSRLYQHFNGSWSNTSDFLEYVHSFDFEEGEDLDRKEKDAIQKLKPYFNKELAYYDCCYSEVNDHYKKKLEEEIERQKESLKGWLLDL